MCNEVHVQCGYCSAAQFSKDELVGSLPPSGTYPAQTPNTAGYKAPNSITDAGFFGNSFSFINPQRKISQIKVCAAGGQILLCAGYPPEITLGPKCHGRSLS